MMSDQCVVRLMPPVITVVACAMTGSGRPAARASAMATPHVLSRVAVATT